MTNINNALSKSLQIATLIRQYIMDNSLVNGDKLPPIAQFASMYSVGKDNVNEAMTLLSYEETVVIKPRHGIFVAGSAWRNLYPKLPEWSAYTNKSIQKLNSDEIIKIYKKGSLSKLLFNPIVNDRIFTDIIIKCFEEVIKTVKTEKVDNQYPIAGYTPLREMLCKHMARYGLSTSPDRVFVMNGLSDSLNAICTATMRLGMELIYNSPIWMPEKQRLNAYNIRLKAMPMDDEGLNKDILAKYLHSSPTKKMLYVTPCYSNPTGTSMSQKRKEDILNICNNTSTPIIEVDSYRALSNSLPPPIASMDTTSNVIYVGTIGEVMPMGYNISWIVAPEALTERFYHYKAQSDFSYRVSQLFFYSLLSSGIYYEHCERFMAYVAKIRTFTQHTLEKYMGDIATWNTNGHPLVYWLKLDDRIDCNAVYDNMQIAILKGSDYATGLDNYFTVSAMNLSKNAFTKNIKYFSEIAKNTIR